MSFKGACDAYEARKAVEVMEDTWGHLKPEKDRTYVGHIIYVEGEYGDIITIESSFEDLGSSPWFFEDLHDFIGSNGEDSGVIYFWEGTYCPSRSTKFIGTFKKVRTESIKAVARL